MRDIKRIDNFTNDLNVLWRDYFPNWRFGQMIFNFNRYLAKEGIDIFYLEEEYFIKYLCEFCDLYGSME